MDLNSIIQMLPELNADELKKVRAGVNTLLDGLPEVIQKRSEGEDLRTLYEAIAERLATHGIGCPPFARALSSSMLRSSIKTLKEFLLLVDTMIPGMTRPKRIHVYGMLTDLIRKRLIQQSIPVTPKIVCEGFGRVGRYIHDEFPGYMEAGLMEVVIEGGKAWKG